MDDNQAYEEVAVDEAAAYEGAEYDGYAYYDPNASSDAYAYDYSAEADGNYAEYDPEVYYYDPIAQSPEDPGGYQLTQDDTWYGRQYDETAYVYEGETEAYEAPTSPFGDEAYWEQHGETTEMVMEAQPGEGLAEIEAPTPIAMSPEAEDPSMPTTESSVHTPSTPSKRKKKGKTKQERIQQRQEQLEKEEEERAKTAEDSAAKTDTADPTTAPLSPGKKTTTRAARPPTFLEREKAKLNLQLRKARSIGRKRIPVQLRVLTETRRHLSPMETYFGGSVEAVLSDIFWASIKGDLRRVKFLAEVEHVDVKDHSLDPWNMQQTPLHWAAKGGDKAVVEYLLHAGVNPRSLDENGSLPLHLACWGGHVDVTLALLRVTDTKDLYVRDYDAALAPLDWANIRGHTHVIKAIEKYEDSLWLPKFVDDLIRGIIRYKIKMYKDAPKGAKSPTQGFRFRPKAAENNAPGQAGDATEGKPDSTQVTADSANKAQATDNSAAAPVKT
ncbi:hypothetical protein Poli38472_005650 [Pythium oligandrum]|uniref:Uncharacterized protein n=1 Tax=Pythium oligandrum TaxID=41045 RepID=A0A8K1FKP1_PYTOL|nr:hypothetical protein Poli38472_005650 [Pythium oligandrum]|eukprot:TMW63032.1 hypothetical protein Poli38472_005650 [Pythium oligandrum]